MAAYSVLMFVIAAVLAVFGLLLGRANTYLMREYHRRKVKDQLAYGKALGKGYFVLSVSSLVSGIVGLLGDSAVIVVTAVVLLFAGIIVGLCAFIKVQKRFTNREF